jgi:hypothetical protein
MSVMTLRLPPRDRVPAGRAATRRFTYGLGRTEDLAGLAILLVMAASAFFAGGRPSTGCSTAADDQRRLGRRYRITIGWAALVVEGLPAPTASPAWPC